jgi:ABC-2 type transport system ATP-binding protein
LAHEQGKTVFVTSHLLDEIEQTCDRVSIINQGKIVVEGTIQDLLHREPWIQLEISSTVKAQQVLQAQGYRLEPTSPPPATDMLGEFIRVKATRQQTPDVVRLLVAQNIEVFMVAPYQQSLEEFFFAVIDTAQHGGHLG